MPGLLAYLGINIQGYIDGINRAKNIGHQFKEGMGSVFGEHLGGKLAGLFTVGAIEESMRRTIEWGSHIYDLSRRLNMSTDAVQQWDHALKLNGSSIQEAIPFLERLATNHAHFLSGAKGAEKYAAAMSSIGLSHDKLKSLRSEDVAMLIAKAFENPRINPDTLTAAARDAGGKGAMALATAFKLGLAEQMEAAPIVSEKTIEAMDRAGDRWTQIFAELRSGLAPIFAWLMDAGASVFHHLIATFTGAYAYIEDAVKQIGILGSALAKGQLPDSKDPRLGMGHALKVASDAMQQYANSVADAEEKERQANINSKKRTGPFGAGDPEESAKQKKADEHESKERRRLIEEEKKLREEGSLKALKPHERVEELTSRILALKKELKEDFIKVAIGEMDENDYLEKKKKAAHLDNELAAALNQDKDKHDRMKPLDVNALQKIGAFAGSPLETMTLDTARKSEHHLRKIADHLTKGDKDTSWSHTRFD